MPVVLMNYFRFFLKFLVALCITCGFYPLSYWLLCHLVLLYCFLILAILLTLALLQMYLSLLKKKSSCCDHLFLCKNFNVAHYSKGIKGINTKPGILANHDKMQLQDKGQKFESYMFGVKPPFNRKFK